MTPGSLRIADGHRHDRTVVEHGDPDLWVPRMSSGYLDQDIRELASCDEIGLLWWPPSSLLRRRDAIFGAISEYALVA